MRSARRSLREGRTTEALHALELGIPRAAGAVLADAWEMVGLAAALEDDEARLREAAVALTRVDAARARAFTAMHLEPRAPGLRGDSIRVPEGVAFLEMKPRGMCRPWFPIRPGTDGMLRVPPGWELKVRLGGIAEEPGTPADLRDWPADAVAELDLSFTRIGDADLVPVARFTRLRRLSLDCVDVAWGFEPMGSKGRGVTSAGVAHLAGLRDLRHLELGTTGIDDAALPHLCRLARLRVLMLNRTSVEGRGLRVLADAGMPLEELGLARSRLTLDAIEVLAGFRRLQALHLDGMIVDSVRFASLRHLPLHTLTASVSTVDAPDLVHLAGLRRLDLTGTSVGDADVKTLAALEGLVILGVRDTGLGEDGLLELARLPSLRRVYAGAEQFSGNAIARATSINPRLEIDRTGQVLDLHLDDDPVPPAT